MDKSTQQQTFPVFSLNRAYLLGRGFSAETAKSLSDEEMQRIAESVERTLVNVFNVCVDVTTQAVLAERDSDPSLGDCFN